MFCGSLVGASLGFLWYNSYPAEIFMGDVGSLALGAALATVAILIKQELLLLIVGGVFVIEALSVVIQVGVVQDDRPARVQDGAAAPPLRADRVERAQGHHPIRDRRDRVRVVQPDDVETSVTLNMTVQGKTRDRRGSGAKRHCRRRAAGTTPRPGHVDRDARRGGRGGAAAPSGRAARARRAPRRDVDRRGPHRAQPGRARPI